MNQGYTWARDGGCAESQTDRQNGGIDADNVEDLLSQVLDCHMG